MDEIMRIEPGGGKKSPIKGENVPPGMIFSGTIGVRTGLFLKPETAAPSGYFIIWLQSGYQFMEVTTLIYDYKPYPEAVIWLTPKEGV